MDPEISPILATFEDRNEEFFGASAYAVWTLKDSSKYANLIMSKAKLASLLKQGDPYKNELCGAVFAAI